ncbi:Hydrolase, NUDIX family [[Clostridium] ultunense Esp]|nr:Hydrolase, NUDIX family [[Clostridium] ultunense Esp]
MAEVAAGGIVYRRQGGGTEILMIEDRFGHWSYPKGHSEGNEKPEETALREIQEETGIIGKIIAPLSSISYRYEAEGRRGEKRVDYFLVEYVSGKTRPQFEEIGNVHWLSPEAAWKKQVEQGYENNRILLEQAFINLGLSLPEDRSNRECSP